MSSQKHRSSTKFPQNVKTRFSVLWYLLWNECDWHTAEFKKKFAWKSYLQIYKWNFY